jgi:hypothetical protein
MQTAMRQLMEYVELNIDDNDFIKQEILEKIDQLIELEKEQIIVAHNYGYLVGEDNISIRDANKASEQYFSLTYNQLPSQSKTLLEILDLENEKNIINEIFDKLQKDE